MGDPSVPAPPPGGREFLEAAKGGERAAMEALLVEHDKATLLAYGGKGCSLGFIGHTALHWACDAGHVEVARLLLERGAAPNAQNEDGSTPLHMARACEHLDAGRLLCEHVCMCVKEREKRMRRAFVLGIAHPSNSTVM